MTEHLSPAHCIDAARGTLSPAEQRDVDRHLERGCERCAELLALWRGFARFAERDGEYDPPAGARRVAGSYLASATFAQPVAGPRTTWRLPAVVATLMVDTMERALPAGVRDAGTPTRQLLYEAPPISIDLHLDAAPDTGRIRLVGQVVDAAHPARATHTARLALMRGAEEVASLPVTRYGEFQCEFGRSDDLALLIALDGAGPVCIPLDRLPDAGRANDSHASGRNTP